MASCLVKARNTYKDLRMQAFHLSLSHPPPPHTHTRTQACRHARIPPTHPSILREIQYDYIRFLRSYVYVKLCVVTLVSKIRRYLNGRCHCYYIIIIIVIIIIIITLLLLAYY